MIALGYFRDAILACKTCGVKLSSQGFFSLCREDWGRGTGLKKIIGCRGIGVSRSDGDSMVGPEGFEPPTKGL